MYAFQQGFEDGYRLALENDKYSTFLEKRYELECEIRALRKRAQEGPAERLWDTIAEAEQAGYYLLGFIEGYHDALSRKERVVEEDDETTPSQ